MIGSNENWLRRDKKSSDSGHRQEYIEKTNLENGQNHGFGDEKTKQFNEFQGYA